MQIIRRKQRLSAGKSKTMWLAWLAWGIIGSIFLFEDSQGGSGVFSFILTSPFWLAFALWPFLWLWLKTRKDPAMVEIDDDITADGKTARLVLKDGVKYVQAEPFSETFRVKIEKTVKLAGGDENFARLDELRDQAKANEAFASWLQIVDGLGKG